MNNKILLSTIASLALISSASAIDITQMPKLFDSNGNDLIEEFDLDPRIFSTVLGGSKLSNSAFNDGLGIFVYSPVSKTESIINKNSISIYDDLINDYYNEQLDILFDDWLILQPTTDEVTDLMNNHFFYEPILIPDNSTTKIVILSNGTVTCPDALPGEILDDGNGNRYYVVDNTTIRDYNITDMTYSIGSEIFDTSHVCTTKVTNMSYLFGLGESNPINIPINLTNWDVSNVTDMFAMFYGLLVDFGNLSNWNVSNVTDMGYMFDYTNYDQPLSNWDVSKVTNMVQMFALSLFNQDISNWNVSNVTNMNSMFYYSLFNQPIGNWNTSKVTDMSGMFDTSPFNQDINNWVTSSVTNMNGMFKNSNFNQPIGNWDISSVNNMERMFNNSPFNQDISSWNVSNVTTMEYMFYNSPFNQPIGNWNVSSVSRMSYMFYNTPFNQPIGNWDVSNVTSMNYMFAYNTSFDQDISMWNVSNVIYHTNFDLNTNSNWTADEKPTFP